MWIAHVNKVNGKLECNCHSNFGDKNHLWPRGHIKPSSIGVSALVSFLIQSRDEDEKCKSKSQVMEYMKKFLAILIFSVMLSDQISGRVLAIDGESGKFLLKFFWMNSEPFCSTFRRSQGRVLLRPQRICSNGGRYPGLNGLPQILHLRPLSLGRCWTHF